MAKKPETGADVAFEIDVVGTEGEASAMSEVKNDLNEVNDAIIHIKNDKVVWLNAAANDELGFCKGLKVEAMVMAEDIERFRALLEGTFQRLVPFNFLAGGSLIISGLAKARKAANAEQHLFITLPQEIVEKRLTSQIEKNSQTEDTIRRISRLPLKNPHPVFMLNLNAPQVGFIPNPAAKKRFSKESLTQGPLRDWKKIVTEMTNSKDADFQVIRDIEVEERQYRQTFIFDRQENTINIYCYDTTNVNCDPVTQLFTRDYLNRSFSKTIAKAAREHWPVTAIMISIDRLNELSGNHGPETGNTILSLLGDLLNKNIRHEDIACRFAENEFFLALAGMDLKDAKVKVEQLVQQIKNLRIPLGKKELRFTISAGVVSGHPITHRKIEKKRSEYVQAAQQFIEAAQVNLGKAKEGQYCATEKP